MSSNAFNRTVELEFPARSGAVRRWFGRDIARLAATAGGDWVLTLRSGRYRRVRLLHGWIAGGGRLMALRFVGSRGSRYACGLACPQPTEAEWRRLLVRLRVPMAGQLS